MFYYFPLGFGVFATDNFYKDDFLLQYRGNNFFINLGLT